MPDPIPAEYGSVTPFVVVHGASRFIEFVQQAFGGVDRGQVPNEDGTIAHSEVLVGDSVIMTFDAQDHWPVTPSFLMLYVPDCDQTHQAALDAGATTVTPLATNAWGDRGSRIRDPLGNIWWIQTHVEDVSEDEMVRRMSEESYQHDMAVSAETLETAMTTLRSPHYHQMTNHGTEPSTPSVLRLLW